MFMLLMRSSIVLMLDVSESQSHLGNALRNQLLAAGLYVCRPILPWFSFRNIPALPQQFGPGVAQNGSTVLPFGFDLCDPALAP